MSEQIFILTDEKELMELNEADFINEDQFQELLEKYPKLLAGSQINSERPRKWLLISREFGVPDDENNSNRWALDHLFLDQDGIPTLVEVKRSSDTRLRREVVAQMLDYAANAVSYWSIEQIRNRFFSYCEQKDKDPQSLLSELLENENDIDRFWESVDTNLKIGKLRMLFVADKIPKELQRIIEFLNEQMNPAEVLGLEIKQYSANSLQTLVPRIVGLTSSAEIKKHLNKDQKQWTRESFFEELNAQRNEKIAKVAEAILEWISPKVSRLWFGKGKTMGSIVPVIDISKSHQLFALWTYGYIEIYFQWYKEKEPFSDLSKREKLLEKLNSIDGISIPKDKIDKRPSIDLEVFTDPVNLGKFKEIYDWVIAEIEQKT